MVLVEFFNDVVWGGIAQLLAQVFETLEDLFEVLGPQVLRGWDIGSVRLWIWRSGICAVRVEATTVAYSVIIVDSPVLFFASFEYGSRCDKNGRDSSSLGPIAGLA